MNLISEAVARLGLMLVLHLPFSGPTDCRKVLRAVVSICASESRNHKMLCFGIAALMLYCLDLRRFVPLSDSKLGKAERSQTKNDSSSLTTSTSEHH